MPPPACEGGTFEWPGGSGYCWGKRDSGGKLAGPGDNYFTPDNVAISAAGSLQLSVTKAGNGGYKAAEVFLASSLGFGDYVFSIETGPDALHPALAGAGFIYQDDEHSLNVEYSKWGSTKSNAPNYDLSVAPSGNTGKKLTGSSYTHRIRWAGAKSLQGITFETWTSAGSLIKSWKPGAGNNFKAGGELVHFNFWMFDATKITKKLPLTASNSVLRISVGC